MKKLTVQEQGSNFWFWQCGLQQISSLADKNYKLRSKQFYKWLEGTGEWQKTGRNLRGFDSWKKATVWVRSTVTWFLLREYFPVAAEQRAREKAESRSLSSHRTEFGTVRAAGHGGGKTRKEGVTEGAALNLYINFSKILGWSLNYMSGETPKRLREKKQLAA